MTKKDKRTIIIEAATHLFAENGFHGVSISQIGKRAGVNQSLLYHYFKSKEDLWTQVKVCCVNASLQGIGEIRYDTIEHFVNDFVNMRFFVYKQKTMQMLVHWQALESDPSQFYGSEGGGPHPVFDIAPHIQKMQTLGLVRDDIDYGVLSALIFGLASYSYFDFARVYKMSNIQQQNYIKAACTMLIQFLKKKNSSIM